MGDMADHLNESAEMVEDYFWTPRQQNLMCKYCHNWGFHWSLTPEGKWRLHTPSGRLHTCTSHPTSKQTPLGGN